MKQNRIYSIGRVLITDFTIVSTEKEDLVGIDRSNGQLCFLSSVADLNEVISIKRSLLKEHPRISFYSNLVSMS
jgi:hypothetical protein